MARESPQLLRRGKLGMCLPIRFQCHSETLNQHRAVGWFAKNELFPPVILRLGEESRCATACVNQVGFFAKPRRIDAVEGGAA
jgi:hypothetical protein